MESLQRDTPPEVPALTTVHLAEAALQALLSEAANQFPCETGGVLLGWTVNDVTHVRQVVGPGPNAHHGTTGFLPDSSWQEDVIARLYQESGRRLSYLGDWHTHPRGIARPSQLDRTTLKVIAAHPPARCPQPLMLIMAGAHDEWELGMYQRLAGPKAPNRRVCRVPLQVS